MTQCILIVDDDETLCRNLAIAVTHAGYRTLTAMTAADALRLCTQADLILLDVMLPDGTGFSCCEQLRALTDVPVIFLTSCSEEQEIVRGLDAGADDYVTKPFRLPVLLSRISANLRRCAKPADASGESALPDLTAAEDRLLSYLRQNAGQYVSREQILSALWDLHGNFVSDNTLSVHISRLREKLAAAHCGQIVTKRGVGYRFVPEPHEGG